MLFDGWLSAESSVQAHRRARGGEGGGGGTIRWSKPLVTGAVQYVLRTWCVCV